MSEKRQVPAAGLNDVVAVKKLASSDSNTSSLEVTAEAQVVHEVIKYDAITLSARHYDVNTTNAVSLYLDSLSDLLSWNHTDDDDFNVAVLPMACRQPPLNSKRPRTLLCHDMKGGYLEDRFIQGTNTEDCYIFYHWASIDIFNYFSHHMVTIPPVCWTNAAHKHGVAVLGTFITEWESGKDICESFLSSEDSFCAVADKMVQIAEFYRFDGWLINIENLLCPDAVKNTPIFLRYLTDKMHSSVPGSLVIWYDSVLEDGKLKWQNELNNQNRVFFNACDGMFTNYNWKEEHLQRMVAIAEDRLVDVYVGVDVFARSEVVGGKFETNLSLQMIRKYGFSAALFAPGWVFECLPTNEFHQNQNKFWNLLCDYLPTHSVSMLPFTTSFCQGFGKRLFFRGKEVHAGNWFNLNAQEMQPLFVDQKLAGAGGSWVRTRGCSEDAWNGGCCLLIEGALVSEKPNVSVRLLSLLAQASPRLFISFIYKQDCSDRVRLALEVTTTNSCSCENSQITTPQDHRKGMIPHLLPETDNLVSQFKKQCDTQPVEGWTINCYLLELQESFLENVFVNISRLPDADAKYKEKEEPFAFRVGEIRILDVNSLFAAPVQVQNLTMCNTLWRRGFNDCKKRENQLYLSTTLRWFYPPNTEVNFRIFCKGMEHHQSVTIAESEKMVLIGRAYNRVYRVVDIPIPDPPVGTSGQVEFLVQPITKEGFVGQSSNCSRLVVNYLEKQ